ncbi:MAG: hypothetical protein H6Q52_1074 [Deltaproteobacteria bacterium]|nr:hypothetical protein [Deltaproteobacteria bacterium]
MALKKIDLPLEVVILLIGGMALVITGSLLYAASHGAVPYYENGFHGLLLVVFALQTMMMGKTPFGDIRRSRALLAAGVIIAAVGIITCFVPTFTRLPRVLLLICFGPGGLVLLLQMCFARDKLRTWIKYGGIFWHLSLGCSTVYVFSMMIALFLWKHSLLPTPMAAAVVLAYGLAVFYLAGVLRKVYRAYPESEIGHRKDGGLSADQAMLLLMGIFMLILGVMLIPVNLGLFPFSGSAQIGLLMVIFAVQMLASGGTPIGPFPRSWLVIALGFLFAALGIVSCIVPEILVPSLTVLVGSLNILGGFITLVKILSPRLRRSGGPRPAAAPVMKKLFAAQLTMNLLTIMFGTSMLIPNLIHGLVIGVILAANGCVLLYLLHILIALNRMQGEMGDAR